MLWLLYIRKMHCQTIHSDWRSSKYIKLLMHKDHWSDNRPRCKLRHEYFEICLYIFKNVCAMCRDYGTRNTYAQKQKYAFTFAYQNMLSANPSLFSVAPKLNAMRAYFETFECIYRSVGTISASWICKTVVRKVPHLPITIVDIGRIIN